MRIGHLIGSKGFVWTSLARQGNLVQNNFVGANTPVCSLCIAPLRNRANVIRPYRYVRAVLGLWAMLWLLGCSRKESVSVSELQAYVTQPEHGLTHTQEVAGLQITATYRPSDLLMAQELGEQTATPEKLTQLWKKYDNLYLTLTLSKDGREVLTPANGFSEFSEQLQVLSFRMGEYVTLLTDTHDTIPVSTYLFQRTYGMGAGNTLLFAFSKAQLKTQPAYIEFKLHEFGMGTGNLSFRFKKEDIEDLPTVDWKHP